MKGVVFMSNFKDFDLELKKVAGSDPQGIDPTEIISEITKWAISKTAEGKCDSVDVPTTGATKPCCKKNNNVEPKCI